MEPDFYQYTYSTGSTIQTQPWTYAQAGQIMGQFVGAMKASLPNALFSMDISPWVGTNNNTGSNGSDNGANWYSNFDMTQFTFINTSGGSTNAAAAQIRGNAMTWAGVSRATGKPILADTGYGFNGSSAGPDPAWDSPTNINARMLDGVVSISQYNPASNWGTTIAGVRGQLERTDRLSVTAGGRIAPALLIAAVIGCRSRTATAPAGPRPRASGVGRNASGPKPTDGATILPGLSFRLRSSRSKHLATQRRSRDARLVGRLAPQAHLSVEQVDDSALDVQLLPPDGSGAPGLRLGFVGDRAGVRTGQVVVRTDLDEPARLTLLYSLRVPSKLTVTPTNPVFDLRDPAGRERRLEVRGHGPDFRVTAVGDRGRPLPRDPRIRRRYHRRRGVDPPSRRRGSHRRQHAARLSRQAAHRQQRSRPANSRRAAVRHGSPAPTSPSPPLSSNAARQVPTAGNEPIQRSDATAKAR